MDCESSKGTPLERILHDPSAEPTNLSLSLLEVITNDFSEHQRIGEGGFASVYKGSLQNGTVAVKKFSKNYVVDDKTFNQEVDSLMKANHKNIVRFLGYCANTEETIYEHEGKKVRAEIRQKLLCFEYMPKGSLDRHITEANKGLEWKMRYQILKGICEGLHYLHMNRILHLDLKPANILLNENMEPKISDFGLSRWLDEDQTRVITSNLSGSMGYMAPERYMKEITFKSDIYSLGIIIFEILTGRKGYSAVDKVLESWQTRFKSPQGDTRLEQVRVCTKIGIECIDFDPTKRPATQHIIETLHETERADMCTSPAPQQEKKSTTELQQSIITKAPEQTSSSTFGTSQHLEKKIEHLPDTAQRLEEKAMNMESENIELRQQAVAISPTRKSPFHLKTPENGNALNEEVKSSPDLTPISLNPKELEAEEKPQKSLNEKQQEIQDLLIKCVSIDLGFSGGKPIAACLIYRCLLHWRSFEVERTGVFDRIIQTIGSAIEDNNDKLAYWLSNSSTLLLLLQRTLKTTGAAGLTPQRRRSSAASFGRVFSGMRDSPQSARRAFLGSRLIGGLGDLRQVEAKYPALLFKQQLTAFLEKVYGMIRDNLKEEISPLLGLCIYQAPRTPRANALDQQILIAHWKSNMKILTNYLNVLKANCVPSFLISKVFTQIFLFINVQLFNSLLLRRECCSFSNGEYVKAGLAELEQWCIYATEEHAGSSWEELKHIRQAVGFLVINQKPEKTLKEVTNDLCPVLSIQQLYRMSTWYWDDKYGTHTVSSDVISSMKVMIEEDSNNAMSSSVLLDDDSSIPFSVDDIPKSMAEVKVADVDMPSFILENSGFAFLRKREKEDFCTSSVTHDVNPTTVNPKEVEAEEDPQKSLNEKMQENQDLLIKCVSQDLGFSSGKPIAACLIYRCLLHWRSFEAERTGVFDRIIQTIGSAMEDTNDKLAYWLSNSSTLLLLLQRTLKITGAAGLTPQRRRSSATTFGRVFSRMRASPQSAGPAFLGSRLIGGPGDLQVEAKYPALLFLQQLTAFHGKMYGMIRDNLKKEISPLLGLCIQAPRTSRASLIKGSRSQANALAQQTLIAHWQSIVKILTNYLNVLKANYVPSFLISKVFTQIFSFINVQLFNSLLLRRECCSLSNGEYVKAGLAELEQWCIYATEEYAGSSWEELKHIRQAVEFLVIRQKPKKTLKEVTNDLCPFLSIQQLYRISTMYWDDKYGTHTVSSDVISSMRIMMTEDSNNAVSSDFLLDDDSSIPFSVDDISNSMAEVKVADVDMPPFILENSGFAFLRKREEED